MKQATLRASHVFQNRGEIAKSLMETSKERAVAMYNDPKGTSIKAAEDVIQKAKNAINHPQT
jgi:hypothetical protein